MLLRFLRLQGIELLLRAIAVVAQELYLLLKARDLRADFVQGTLGRVHVVRCAVVLCAQGFHALFRVAQPGGFGLQLGPQKLDLATEFRALRLCVTLAQGP